MRRLRSEFFYLGPKKVVNLRLTFISSTSVSHEKSNSGWSKLANGLSWRVWGYGYSLKKRNKQVIEGSSQVTLFLQLRLTTFIHIPSYKEDLGEEIHFTDGNDSSPCQPTYLFLTTSPMSVSMEWPEQTRIKAIATRIKVIPTPSEPDRSVPYWVKPCRTKGSLWYPILIGSNHGISHYGVWSLVAAFSLCSDIWNWTNKPRKKVGVIINLFVSRC